MRLTDEQRSALGYVAGSAVVHGSELIALTHALSTSHQTMGADEFREKLARLRAGWRFLAADMARLDRAFAPSLQTEAA